MLDFAVSPHPILKALTNSCENLEELTFYLEYDDEAEECLLKILEISKYTLKYFKIYSPYIYIDPNNFLDMLGKCKNMKSLCIDSNFFKFVGHTVILFKSAISNMKNLTSFAVDNTYGISVSPNAIVTLFSCGYFKNLKALEFYCNYSEEVTENDINDIIEAIEKGCPKLEELELYYNYVSFEISRGRRTIYCNECKVYHLKNQRYYLSQRCPYKE